MWLLLGIVGYCIAADSIDEAILKEQKRLKEQERERKRKEEEEKEASNSGTVYVYDVIEPTKRRRSKHKELAYNEDLDF